MCNAVPVPRRRQVMCPIGNLVYMFGGTNPDPSSVLSVHEMRDVGYGDPDFEPLKELDDLWILDLGG